MSMLFSLAGVIMCCSAVSALLPQGSIKRTASLVMGLIVLSMWFSSLCESWPELHLPQAPDTIFEQISQGETDTPPTVP